MLLLFFYGNLLQLKKMMREYDMNNPSTFDLNMWNLQRQPLSVQTWFQAAYQHDINTLRQHEHILPSIHLLSSVNALHLFACAPSVRDQSRQSSKECLYYLLENGGSMAAQDAYGWLPLNYACFFAHASTVDLLLEAGSPVHNIVVPQPLDSALQAYAQHHNTSAKTCARLLMIHGADPRKGLSSDMHWGGVTWLVWALVNKEWDLAKMLYDRGVQSLSIKEKTLLSIRGHDEAFVWAECHGIPMLEKLSPGTDAYQKAQQARVDYEKSIIQNALRENAASPSDKSDEGDGTSRGKKRM